MKINLFLFCLNFCISKFLYSWVSISISITEKLTQKEDIHFALPNITKCCFSSKSTRYEFLGHRPVRKWGKSKYNYFKLSFTFTGVKHSSFPLSLTLVTLSLWESLKRDNIGKIWYKNNSKKSQNIDKAYKYELRFHQQFCPTIPGYYWLQSKALKMKENNCKYM